MLQRMKVYIDTHKMTEPGEKLVLGLSGGMDSVCLFHLLLEAGYPLEAVHVHHGIRGSEADRDAAFAGKLCERFGVSFHEFRFDVPGLAKARHLSVEEAGRAVRREAFLEVMMRTGAKKIALAHHANDRAETMLFHLCRGTGLKGLASIQPVEGVYIRPLLWATRREIEAYVENRGYSYVEDSTNGELDYTRNKLRHQVLPVLTEINEAAVTHMAKAAEKLSALEHYVEREAAGLYEECVGQEKESLLIREGIFLQADEVLQAAVLRRCVGELSGSLKDITQEHLLSLQKLFLRQTGRELCLPYGIMASRSYEGIRLFLSKESEVLEEQTVTVPGALECGGKTFTFCVEEAAEREMFPTKLYTKWFDYDKIKGIIRLRTRKKGDYLEINREHGRKALQDYMVNEKIPKEERDQVLLLADGNHILWVVGRRISEYYKVTKATKRILKVQVNGGKEDEG